MVDSDQDSRLPLTFSGWWNLAGEWIEPPNQRRGGWSGVQHVSMGGLRYFIKKQCNHTYRSFGWPIRRPTVEREYRNLLRLAKLGIQAPTPVFYGERRSPDCIEGLLVTEELSGFAPLTQQQDLPLEQRTALAAEAGRTFARFHRAGLQHRALYDKHILVRWPTPDSPEIALIDLESMRHTLFLTDASRHDLKQLKRRQNIWTENEWRTLVRSHARHMHERRRQ